MLTRCLLHDSEDALAIVHYDVVGLMNVRFDRLVILDCFGYRRGAGFCPSIMIEQTKKVWIPNSAATQQNLGGS